MTSDNKILLLKELLDENGYIRGPFGSSLKRNELKAHGIPVYEQQHAIYNSREFRFYIDDSKYEQMKRFTIETNDLLISCSGTVGKVTLIQETDPKGIISQALLILRANTNIILPKFLKYFFESKEGYNSIISRSSGSVQVNIAKRKVIENIPINGPDIKTQQKIAKILSAIDDKIELNNKINANLEEQTQCYFSSTISESKNVQYVTIGNICDVKGGKRLPKGINLITTPNSHPYIRVRDLNNTCVAQLNNSYEFVDNETQKLISRYTVNSQDVVISIVGTIGLTAIIGNSLNNANLTENCVKLTNLKQITPEFLLLFLRSKTGQDIINKSTVGAVQAKLPIKNIQAIQIPLISDNSLNDYLRAIFKNIANNLLENENLIQLRDTLLSKLMNGEINVEKIQP
ncbi:MAG: restriction endonuclease subunit S [Spirochaetales bacterium]|nr:restriction endonuclease subunit S [Spirochaetales bacterium]